MCGILGCKGRRSKSQVRVAAESIRHRGPDAFGFYEENDVSLAHHRLAIIDLSEKAAQPFQFQHLVIVFNGEIYNYKEIRAQLLNSGYTFHSDSDTEVLIKAFHKWGTDSVHRLIGMFAFAVYDKSDDSIYLFRDRIGVKPLYYCLDDGLAFGSELRSILPLVQSWDLNHEAIYQYFRLGYISRNQTIFRQAQKLLPGHFLHYKNKTATVNAYWQPDQPALEDEQLTPMDWKEMLHGLMKDAFSLRMLSDVPVGVFLSGGVDSSLVSAILQKHHGSIHTFTISFDEPKYDEAPYAKAIAQHLGTNHTEFKLYLEDASKIFSRFYDIYDEPFADSSGIPATVISRLAADAGMKVVLSADGGDELFAGYDHYQKSFNLFNRINALPDVAKMLTRFGTNAIYRTNILRHVHQGNWDHKVATLNELVSSSELGQFYDAFIANQAPGELSKLLKEPAPKGNKPIARQDISGLMRHDLHHYLPDDLLVKIDRATMHNSIEGREPFLDHRLVELSLRMPTGLKIKDGQSKWILKEILSEYIPKEYFLRPKKGFSIPIFKWFNSSLDQYFEYYLSPERIKRTGIFNVKEVAHEQVKYKWNKKRGKAANIEKMWRILSFMMWWEKWHRS